MNHRLLALGALALAGSYGCEGSIGDPGAGTTGKPPLATKAPDPGRVTMHRLNRAEYDNTVRDLLGTALHPADDFPADDHSYGFDNIADVLTISPVQFELYARAAELLAAEAMALPSLSETRIFEGETLTGTAGDVSGQAWLLWSNGEVPATVVLPADGTYKISTLVWGDQAGPEAVQMSIDAAGVSLGIFDVPQTAANPAIFEQTTTLTAGTKVVSVAFLNDYYDEALGLDSNLYVDWIKVEGPIGAAGTNPLRDRLITCDLEVVGEPCAREVIGAFAKRAYRRPVTDVEVDDLMALVKLATGGGDTIDGGVQLALTAILTSPHFLFRPELDPDPTSLEPHPLGAYELASRLSYFLWSSMPDDALLDAAGSGALDTPEGIASEVARMIADPKSEALIDNFAGQWLYTRALADHQPDYAKYPRFDEPLRAAMRTETDRFFAEFLRGDRPVSEMLTADFTFVDARLASHYGIPEPAGGGFEQVTLASDRRGGLLSQASLLTVTSYPARTSPVKRGKWILTQILCSEPPPPPPGVEGLKPAEEGGGSIRDQLEAHRADPFCASCHSTMDPLGFGLEHYDGIGAWRDDDAGFVVDATGALPSGETFDGAQQMASLVSGDPRFAACVAQKLFTYALGRGARPADAPYINAAVKDFEEDGSKLRQLVSLVATSDPFRTRRGEAAEGGSK